MHREKRVVKEIIPLAGYQIHRKHDFSGDRRLLDIQTRPNNPGTSTLVDLYPLEDHMYPSGLRLRQAREILV